MEEIQRKLQSEMEKFKALEKEFQKALGQRQALEGQLHENLAVKEELDLIKDGESEVYKLIGPVLVKQELVDAKQNVNKRIDYINGELKRVTDLITTLENKQDAHKEKLIKLQNQFVPDSVKQAGAAPS